MISFLKNLIYYSFKSKYQKKIKNAEAFTRRKGLYKYPLSSYQLIDSSVQNLVDEISKTIQNEVQKFDNTQISNAENFGQQCANVHYSLLKFIKDFYTDLNAQLTIGGVGFGSQTIYKLDETTFNNCIDNNIKPIPLNCHVWITIGNNIIIDATLGTNLITKSNKNSYGGIIYGYEGNLKWIKIDGVENIMPDKFNSLRACPEFCVNVG